MYVQVSKYDKHCADKSGRTIILGSNCPGGKMNEETNERSLLTTPVTPNGDLTAFVCAFLNLSARCGNAAKYD